MFSQMELEGPVRNREKHGKLRAGFKVKVAVLLCVSKVIHVKLKEKFEREVQC